ncbi:MAG TPA: hypothetical protein PKL65_02410 [Bacteroidales bacterium]|nr:hypothetical protein [Bacteroidales bacterium]
MIYPHDTFTNVIREGEGSGDSHCGSIIQFPCACESPLPSPTY